MLNRHYRIFVGQLDRIRDRANLLEAEVAALPSWKKRYLSQALIFDLWTRWSVFARNVILASCLGTATRSGNLIAPRVGDNSWQRLGYLAKNANSRPSKISPTGRLNSMYAEPTWGDISKLPDYVKVINPNNIAQLLAAFSLSSLRSPKDLQIIRNACAHRHVELLVGDIRRIRIYYFSPTLNDPSDIVWQVEANSKILAIYCWLDNLSDLAEQMTL